MWLRRGSSGTAALSDIDGRTGPCDARGRCRKRHRRADRAEREPERRLTRHRAASAPAIDVRIGVSNRHIHLSAADAQLLFGSAPLTVARPLTQPGQFAANESVRRRARRGSSMGSHRRSRARRNAARDRDVRRERPRRGRPRRGEWLVRYSAGGVTAHRSRRAAWSSSAASSLPRGISTSRRRTRRRWGFARRRPSDRAMRRRRASGDVSRRAGPVR